MKQLMIVSVSVLISTIALAQPPKVPADKGSKFGKEVAVNKAIDVNEMANTMGTKESAEVNVKAEVVEVCKAEGCWIKVKTANGNMMVKMKDHAFLVPLALNGKQIAITGTAVNKVTTVAQLKHYAEDAGKSKAEIDAIKEDKKEILIQAKGIEVLN